MFEDIITWKSYNCTFCTFANEKNPGPKCETCESPAPDDAKVVTVSPQKIAYLAKKEKEEEENRKRQEREQRAKEEENRQKAKMQEQIREF